MIFQNTKKLGNFLSTKFIAAHEFHVKVPLESNFYFAQIINNSDVFLLS